MTQAMADRAVFIGGLSIIAASVLYGLVERNNGPKHCITSSDTMSANAEPSQVSYPDEIKDELHSRVKTFFSEEGFQKLQNSFIVVRG